MKSNSLRSFPGRSATGFLIFAGLLSLFVGFGCSGPAVRAPAEPGAAPALDRERQASPEARERFDEAARLYRSGRFNEAEPAFRLIGAEFPNDQITVLAELWLGRTLLALGRHDEAKGVFRSLSQDAAMATSAKVYLGFAAALGDEEAERISAFNNVLRSDPDARLATLHVVDGDAALIASLLAETRLLRRDLVGALRDLGDVRDAEGVDPTLSQYAMDRGRQLAELEMSESEQQEALAGRSAFARALVAPPIFARRLDGGDSEGAREILEESAEAMVRMGLDQQLVAMQRNFVAVTETQELRYGIIVSLSGANRRAGRAALGAVLLAQRAFEPDDAVSVLLIRDARGRAESVRQAVEELASAGVLGIIGPIESELSEVGRERSAELGVPFISLSPLAFESSLGDSWRLLLSAEQEGRTAVEEAMRVRGVTRFALLEERDPAPWMREFSRAAVAAVHDGGGEIVVEAPIADGDALQDSAEQAAALIARTDADAVILALPAAAASTTVAWLASSNVWSATDARGGTRGGRRHVTLIGNSFLLQESVLRNSGEYLGGAIIPWWYTPELATGAAASFTWRFEHVFGRPPGTVEAFAYDAASLMRGLIVGEGHRTRSGLAERLHRLDGFEGITGMLHFDSIGNLGTRPGLATVQNGRFVLR